MHERVTQPADALDVRQRMAAVERDTILAPRTRRDRRQPDQAAKKLGISRSR